MRKILSALVIGCAVSIFSVFAEKPVEDPKHHEHGKHHKDSKECDVKKHPKEGHEGYNMKYHKNAKHKDSQYDGKGFPEEDKETSPDQFGE